MPVNADKVHRWKEDIALSVDFYNEWFTRFAPKTYRETRVETTRRVETALHQTENLSNIKPSVLRQNPSALFMLRMSTAPPIARDRLIGLTGVPSSLVQTMEKFDRVPPRMASAVLERELGKIGDMITRLADRDIFVWLEEARTPTATEIHRAATVVADRLCGAKADPIIRNAQEQRQLAEIKAWLEARAYRLIASGSGLKINAMQPGTFAFRLNLPVRQVGRTETVNIPADVVIMPRDVAPGDFPLLIEAKSAGDFTNTNKRRKEEATKIVQLRATYGPNVRFVLFLCGYFDSGYLGYEAAEGIDWVWEHRIDDLAEFGL